MFLTVAARCELRRRSRYDVTMGFGGLTLDKIFVILLIALFVVGPDKLPVYAKKLGEFVRSLKRMADGAKDRLRDEMGPEFDEVDWKQLDPRQYDPRRIIRDALLEDEREAQVEARKTKAMEAAQARRDRVQARAEEVAGGMTAGAVVAAAGAGSHAAASSGSELPGDAGSLGANGNQHAGAGAASGAGTDPAGQPVSAGLNFDDEAT